MVILPTLLLAALPSQETTVAPLIREGAHVRVHCHIQDEAAADHTLLAAEAAWRIASETYGLGLLPKDAPAGQRYDFHLYADAASYRAVDQELTGGNFARNLAFAHFDSISAHVAIQPPLKPGALKVLGLPRQTTRLISHEVAHLYRYAHNNNFRSHPDWLADGVASMIELKVLAELGSLQQWEQDPYVGTSIAHVQALLKEDRLPSLESILLDETSGLQFYERYDTRWMMVEYLAEKKPELLQDLLKDARRLGGGSEFAKRLMDEFPKKLSPSKLKSMDRGFRKFVAEPKPVWYELYRQLYPFEGRLAQASFDSNAIAWRQEDSGEKYRIAGDMTILEGTRTQLNVFLGKNEMGFHSVAFTAGYGITVFAFHSSNNQWVRIGTAKVEGFEVATEIGFSIDVEGTNLTVGLGGDETLVVETKDMPLHGPFALSAQAGSVGIWDITEAPGW